MDITTFAITGVFFIFLIVSYYLKVIRLSVPLVIIYLFYCFNYLIKTDHNLNSNNLIIRDERPPDRIKTLGNTKTPDKNIQSIDENQNRFIPKPIVSYTPKPIVIDSNIIIQKDIDDKSETLSSDNIGSLEDSKIDKKDTINDENNLYLNEIMICRGIYKRNPIKPGYNFINNVDSLFCYTKITNSGPKQEIKHIWFFEEQQITSVVYNIKTSYNYRSWSKKNISPKQIGNWRVDVVDEKGNVLGSRDFSVKSINSIY